MMGMEEILLQADAHRKEANSLFWQQNYAQARSCYADALVLYERVWTSSSSPDKALKDRIFHALHSLGFCAAQEQDYATSRDYYLRAFDFDDKRYMYWVEYLYSHLLDVCVPLHDVELGMRCLHELRRLNERRTDQRYIIPLCDLGKAAVEFHAYDTAWELFAQALFLCEQHEDPQRKTLVLWQWGIFAYQHCSRADGLTLCRLALLNEEELIDQGLHATLLDDNWRLFNALRLRVAQMEAKGI
jgi:tetratricopeptide (TPR) repeat protein